MVMAFLGAIFILGKMSESTSNVTGEGAQWKVGISSASPGIILSSFGTILLITSLLIRTTIDLSDGAAYITVLRRPATSAVPAPASPQRSDDAAKPLDLSDIEKLSQPADKPAPKSNKKE